MLEEHQAPWDTTSEERAGLEFFPLPQLQETQDHPRALAGVAEQLRFQEQQASPLLRGMAGLDWPEVAEAGHTIHRPRTPELLKAETGAVAIDSLEEL